MVLRLGAHAIARSGSKSRREENKVAHKRPFLMAMTIEERTENERQRLRALLFDYNISEQKVSLMDDLITNVAWMRTKLEDTRETIRQTNVAISYDGGVKENPLFKGYEALWKSYMSGMRVILDLLPVEEARLEQADRPKTVLELVRERHNA